MTIMNRFKRLALTAPLALALVASMAAPARAEQPEYRLGFGDALAITVVGQPNLSVADQPVRPDGEISLPMVPRVRVAGLTVSELTRSLSKLYKPYYADPQVIVQVTKFRPQRLTLLGQVSRPGSFAFDQAPTLADAIAAAGGLTERASRDRIKVVDPNGKTVVYDLARFTSGQERFPRIADGSVIEVEEVWTPDVVRYLPFVASLVTAGVLFLR